MDCKVEMLRHTLATVAYRGAKALRGAPPEFASYRCGEQSRTPGEILAHIGDLYDWALGLADGEQRWNNSPALDWEAGSARFFAVLKAFDDRLASGKPLGYPAEKIFQGPIADSLNHIGQIAMLRRLAGSPIKGESYFRAEITAGAVGAEQVAAAREFD